MLQDTDCRLLQTASEDMLTCPPARELNGPGYYDLPEGAEIDDRSITKEAACFFKEAHSQDGSKEGRSLESIFWCWDLHGDHMAGIGSFMMIRIWKTRHILLPAS